MGRDDRRHARRRRSAPSADTLAAYLFDTIHFSEQLLFSGGLRWERYKSEFDPAPSHAAVAELEPDRRDCLTWRAGLTYKPMPSLSLYVGAGTSVNPSIENLTQTTPTAAVARSSPSGAGPIEIGAKWDGFGGKLLLTAALFRTDKTNARTPGLPGEPADRAGRQATGRRVRVRRDRPDHRALAVDRRLHLSRQRGARIQHRDRSRQPARQRARSTAAALWTTYKLPIGFELGGGVRYVGTRYTNVTNTGAIDDYWVADATIGL